jgi:hypothetical protein
MQIKHGDRTFETQYFPYFRIKKTDRYQIFGMRLPSGLIDRINVPNDSNMWEVFHEHLQHLVDEYMVEEDDALTPHGKRLKGDVNELFIEK